METIPESERAWVHHNASLLEESDIAFLEALPKNLVFQVDGTEYGMAHLYQDYDRISNLYAFHQFRKYTFSGRGNPGFSRLILGHTHRQGLHYLSDLVFWLNPGSVSYRRSDDPDQTAHYATIIDGKVSLKRLAYDLSPLRREIRNISLKSSEIQSAKRFFGKRHP
jgi:predicted phosphodiesterase